ncbi:MAG: tRNA (adenosine(37)-N6)-dimethylallyltransferase MiaA [Oscillospiraceae bacterium]
MDNIICVVGPTASGKTAFAVRLAQSLDGEVISCDSMQIYRRMDIGTAKPTAEEMAQIPHHMIGIVEPDEDFSVGKYVQMADAVLQDVLARGKTAVICGGTGLYVDSLIAGRSFAPYPATGKREALERRAAEEGIGPLLARLREVDPASAARLHASDEKRIIRALEVFDETGKTITWHNEQTQKQPPRYTPYWLGLDFADRNVLYSRIDRRVDLMLEAGLLDEIRALVAGGVPESCTAMQAIGYKEYLAALRGETSFGEATALVKQRSRNYAKRQLTWFRRNKSIHWLLQQPGQDFDGVFRAACRDIPFFAHD